jgi:hypothetical protein
MFDFYKWGKTPQDHDELFDAQTYLNVTPSGITLSFFQNTPNDDVNMDWEGVFKYEVEREVSEDPASGVLHTTQVNVLADLSAKEGYFQITFNGVEAKVSWKVYPKTIVITDFMGRTASFAPLVHRETKDPLGYRFLSEQLSSEEAATKNLKEKFQTERAKYKKGSPMWNAFDSMLELTFKAELEL